MAQCCPSCVVILGLGGQILGFLIMADSEIFSLESEALMGGRKFI